MKTMRNIGIFLFDEVEVLDFAGPFEVFSVTCYPDTKDAAFCVKTVAQKKAPVRARNGLYVIPDYSFEDAPPFDILIIPGGYGAEEIEIHNAAVIAWIRERLPKVSILASVCTGAFLLAEAGLLNGSAATTHWMDVDRLEREYGLVKVQRGVRYVDEGKIVTSAGIASGIHMSLHLVERLLGEKAAKTTSRRMEYDW
jgi:transcriptional regulator GlxA family with amidase domain